MKKLNISIVLACSLLLFGLANQGLSESRNAQQESYQINLSAKPISKYKVKFTVQTNIPLPVEVMASVDLRNQKPDDIYIGYSEKVHLKKSTEVFIVDTKSKKLPKGSYDANVTFYPFWGARNGNPKASKIKTTVSDSFRINLKGSGQTAIDVGRQKEMQKWIMLNVEIGTIWNEKFFTRKLGAFHELPLRGNWNPEIIKVYYFPTPDMTIFVNILENAVATWKMGKTSTM